MLVFADEVHCYTATHDDDIYGHDVFHPVKLIGTRIHHYSLCFQLEKFKDIIFGINIYLELAFTLSRNDFLDVPGDDALDIGD